MKETRCDCKHCKETPSVESLLEEIRQVLPEEKIEVLLTQMLMGLDPKQGYCKYCLEEIGVEQTYCKEHQHVDNDE